MRAATLMTLIAAPLALAACDSGEEAMETEDMPMAENMPMSGETPMLGSDAEMRMASAEGTVTAIDKEAGTITIDHGPVPAVDWPAMTMAFKADAASMQTVAIGDEVTFEFRTSAGDNEITSIRTK